MFLLEIDDCFKDQNVLFHYTKLNTALEHILFNSQLRLSGRRNAADPLESIVHGFSTSELFKVEEYEEIVSQLIEKSKCLNEYNTRLKQAKQISFCKNAKDFREIEVDDYGFLNLRMWDQYADKFRGVCLAFSQSELIKSRSDFMPTASMNLGHIQKENDLLFYKEVDYLGFDDFSFNKDERKILAANRLKTDKVGFEEDAIQAFVQRLFTKHKTYSGENEFRIINFNKSEFLSFDFKKKGDLIGMFYFENGNVSLGNKINYLSEFAKKSLKEYAKKFEVPLFEIQIKTNSYGLFNLNRVIV